MRQLPRWRYYRQLSQRFKAALRVKVLLHDLSSDELIAGLQNASLELAVMVYQPNGGQTAGIQFELLRTYPLCVAMTAIGPGLLPYPQC